MDKKSFEKIVEEGIKMIPQEFLNKMNNIVIVVENNPTVEQIKKIKMRKDQVLFGLYEGIPKTKRVAYGQVIPDKITIFKNQIESVSKVEEKIKEIVKDTVWHEIGHHFGMTEEQIRAAEKKKKERKK
ncbi:metallopeptidase family protein [bacterium]|nr:metallopeptidase family protein [bacterium]